MTTTRGWDKGGGEVGDEAMGNRVRVGQGERI